MWGVFCFASELGAGRGRGARHKHARVEPEGLEREFPGTAHVLDLQFILDKVRLGRD